LTVSQPLSLLIVGGLLLLYFYREVRPVLASARPSEYLITGTAFFIALATTVQLVSMLLRTLGGQGDRVENLIVSVLPGLLAGSLVWRWRWRGLDREATDPSGVEARSDVLRKVYLHFYQLVGLLLMLVGGVTILQQIVASLLGQPSFGNVLVEQSAQLALLIVGGGLMIYVLQIIASDTRLGALSVEDAMRRTLGDTIPTWAIAAVVGLIVGPFFVIVLLALLGPAIGSIFNNIISTLD